MMADINHSERAHARFSPSASDRWLACPASVRLSDNLPESPSSIASTAGTICHEVAEEYLRNWQDPETGITEPRSAVIKGGPHNGEKVTVSVEDLKKHVVPYVNAVRDTYGRAVAIFGKDAVQLLVEEKVDIEGGDCYGTLDAAVITPVNVHCFDLKAGYHVVEADAPQFRSYLLGLAKKYVPKESQGTFSYYAHVCQAADQAEPHKWNNYTWLELQEHQKRIRKAIKLSETAEPGPAGEHCKWCPVKENGDCPAQHQLACQVLEMADAEEEMAALPKKDLKQEITKRVDNLSLPQKLHLHKMAPVLRAMLDSVEATLLGKAMAGEELIGWKAVRGSTKRKYNPALSPDEIAEELELYGIDPWERKLKSFTKIEEIAEQDTIDIGHLLVKPEGAPTLVPESDKRPSINNLSALENEEL